MRLLPVHSMSTLHPSHDLTATNTFPLRLTRPHYVHSKIKPRITEINLMKWKCVKHGKVAMIRLSIKFATRLNFACLSFRRHPRRLKYDLRATASPRSYFVLSNQVRLQNHHACYEPFHYKGGRACTQILSYRCYCDHTTLCVTILRQYLAFHVLIAFMQYSKSVG